VRTTLADRRSRFPLATLAAFLVGRAFGAGVDRAPILPDTSSEPARLSRRRLVEAAVSSATSIGNDMEIRVSRTGGISTRAAEPASRPEVTSANTPHERRDP
jgi:hypothetical protein